MTSELNLQNDLKKKAEEIEDYSDAMGHFIYEQIIMSRRVSDGGSTNEILGPQGTGKTSFMLNIAKEIMGRFNDEIVIWKDSYESQSQFNRVKDWEIFVQKGVKLQFKDIYKNEIIELPQIFFSDFGTLLNKMSPGQLNVVYVKDEIIDFIRLLNYLRRVKGWQSVFIDEYKDIAPLNESGFKHRLIGALGDEMSKIRRGLVSLFCNTQSKSQIDYRVRSAFMTNIYLSGARKNKQSSILQKAINRLSKGRAWIDWDGKYGRVKFPPFPPKIPVMDVDDLNKKSKIDSIIDDMKNVDYDNKKSQHEIN